MHKQCIKMHMECIRDLYEGIRNAYEKHNMYLKFWRYIIEIHKNYIRNASRVNKKYITSIYTSKKKTLNTYFYINICTYM